MKRQALTRTHCGPALALACFLTAGSPASAANPLIINGDLSPTDLIAIGFDGPNSPAASTFYYDLYTFTVDTSGAYDFTIDGLDAGLAPWVGIYANNFNALDYWSPTPLDLAADPVGGGIGSVSIALTPGIYQAIASSVDWIEEPDALDQGAYQITISGPPGAIIELVPPPSAAMTFLISGLVVARRRRA